jgi:hypothetical protein
VCIGQNLLELVKISHIIFCFCQCASIDIDSNIVEIAQSFKSQINQAQVILFYDYDIMDSEQQKKQMAHSWLQQPATFNSNFCALEYQNAHWIIVHTRIVCKSW